MSSSFVMAEIETTARRLVPFQQDPLKSLAVDALANQDQAEVLAFLSRRPIHTVFMSSLIRDNGLVHACNRGLFHGYRNEQGTLEGVALIGQKTVIEAHGDAPLKAFAQLALNNPHAQLIRGEQEQMESLLVYLARYGRAPRLVNRELLMEQLSPAQGVESVPGLRRATLSDMDNVININAAMAFEEHGVNPLQKDSEGTCQRVRRRLEQGRGWVLMEDGQIVFKADVISETPEVIFIEGVYVHPSKRGQGYGLRCMTQLARNLLSRTASLCLVVNQENKRAQSLYLKAGYQLHSHYRTVYFQSN